MLHRFRTALVCAAISLACTAAIAQDIAPSVIYHHGQIVTANARFDIVQAVAVRDGAIVAVGTNDAIRKLAGPSTRLIDLQGRTMLPGFYDNHIHLGEGVQEWRGGLVPAASEWLRPAKTIDEIIDALRRRAAQAAPGEWIRGTITREDWGNQVAPTRTDLDRASTDHPIAIVRGPHTLILNSLALQKAGITRDTPDPPGGWIFKDAKGEPNGRVLEAARRMVERVIPRPPQQRETAEATIARYRTHLQKLASIGVSSVNIAGLRPNELHLLQELYARPGADMLPRSTVQVRISPGYDTYDDIELGVKNSIAEVEGLGFRTGFGNERLKIGAIKMSIDGGLSAPVFWSTIAYKGRPGFFGTQRIPADAFYRVAKRAHELGWQVGVHTMGDAAVVMVVDELEKILKESPRADHRHYLHHVAVMPPEATLKKMGALGIGVASQPGFTLALGAYAEEALEGEREAAQNPSRTLLDHGIRLSYGSDGAPYGPLLALWCAVTRKGWDGRVHGAGEAVTLQQAITFHTAGSAWMMFDETSRGVIEPGKAADFVVLGEDILHVNPDRIPQIPIERTIVGGKEIFSRTPTANGR